MRGINICAAAEAISFARALNVDLAMYYELVNNAAGGSRIFADDGLELIRGGITTTLERADMLERLQKVTQKARDLNCPLYLGSAAYNVLVLAKRKGGVARIFE